MKIALILLCLFIAGKLPFSNKNQYKSEVLKHLQPTNPDILTENDIAHLPPIVQKYLAFTGNLGQPKVTNVNIISQGQMKQSEQSNWIDIKAEQYDFFDKPTRLFYIVSNLFGIPFDGFHSYTDQGALMLIKVASLFKVVDARGDIMNQSETVTYFNDMCLLAPASLIDPAITWREIDPTTVEAKYSNLGTTITATLYFDSSGALVNFISNDRYLSADGKKYQNYPWSTPIRDYKVFNGRKIASYGEAIWHQPQGDYIYAKYHLKEAQFNVNKFE